MTRLEKIDRLLSLCSQGDIDLDAIEAHIVRGALSGEIVTKTAIKLVERWMWEVDSFRSKNAREPKREELFSSRLPALFDLLLKHGLAPNAVYCDDGFAFDNLLHSLLWVDNEYAIYDVLRLLLQNGGDPNVLIEDETLFEKVDGDLVTDMELMAIEGRDRDPFERQFRFWLLLIAYGGRLPNGKKILDMKQGYDVDVFERCERFSYRKEMVGDEPFLHIYITETGQEVAVL